MKKISFFTFILLGVLLGFSTQSNAALIDLSAVADASVRNQNPNLNDGGATTYAVVESFKLDRGLIRWDIQSDVLESTINSASIKLYVRYLNYPDYYAPNTVLNVYQVSQAWTEMGVTWNTTDGSTAWSAPGNTGDLSSPYVSQTFASTGWDPDKAYPREDLTISIDVTSLVQNWAAGANNYGLMFVADNNSPNTFWTREASILPESNPSGLGAAILTIDYNPIPEPATMLLLGSGLIGLAGFREKSKRS